MNKHEKKGSGQDTKGSGMVMLITGGIFAMCIGAVPASAPVEQFPDPFVAQTQMHAVLPLLASVTGTAMRSNKEDLKRWELTKSYALSIPSLAIKTPVYVPSRRYWDARAWDALETQMQSGLRFGAVTYPGIGDAPIIVGHSSPPSTDAPASPSMHVFERLPDIKTGDKIFLTGTDGSHSYTVTRTAITDPDDISVLRSAQRNTLSLMTCYPVGTTDSRFIVTAKMDI